MPPTVPGHSHGIGDLPFGDGIDQLPLAQDIETLALLAKYRIPVFGDPTGAPGSFLLPGPPASGLFTGSLRAEKIDGTVDNNERSFRLRAWDVPFPTFGVPITPSAGVLVVTVAGFMLWSAAPNDLYVVTDGAGGSPFRCTFTLTGAPGAYTLVTAEPADNDGPVLPPFPGVGATGGVSHGFLWAAAASQGLLLP